MLFLIPGKFLVDCVTTCSQQSFVAVMLWCSSHTICGMDVSWPFNCRIWATGLSSKALILLQLVNTPICGKGECLTRRWDISDFPTRKFMVTTASILGSSESVPGWIIRHLKLSTKIQRGEQWPESFTLFYFRCWNSNSHSLLHSAWRITPGYGRI